MIFNSGVYFLFLPLTVGLFWLLRGRARVVWLLLASYVFYAWWDYRFLSLIVASTAVDFVAAGQIARSTSPAVRRRWLVASISFNIAVLAFFKYWDFFITSGAQALESLGLQPNVPLLRILLPIGISFYTFQTMSYTIDVFRDRVAPEPDITRFALFVAFFPQLVAGPIERASRLMPQLQRLDHAARKVEWGAALTLLLRGLFRKVVIADGVAPLVNQVYGAPSGFGGITVALAIIGFSLQIYGDFGGYTDIARGSAKLFGVDLMENFRAPYRARGFSDFWKRWHISLSSWLRDYLYIPLGGNRGSRLEILRNLMLTMVLGGLWHGAGWGFVVWGALHGLYLCVERVLRWKPGRKVALGSLATFGLVSLTWIPFRSASLGDAVEMLRQLTHPFEGAQLMFAPVTVALLGLFTIWIDEADLTGEKNPLLRWAPVARGFGYGVACLVAFLYWPVASVPFIYFQF